MALDLFRLRIDPDRLPADPAGHYDARAEIWINGFRLLDMVRGLEGPFVTAERRQRNADGDRLSETDFGPGQYHELPARCVLLPNRELLDEPADRGFILQPDDPQVGKATVLGCTCGIVECWFLQVRITLSESTVVWSDFGQFHREGWQYDLGPFSFERRRYEAELARTPVELTHNMPALAQATHL